MTPQGTAALFSGEGRSGPVATSPRKQRVLDFYRLFYNERRFEEGARLLAEGYVNHRPDSSGVGPAAAVRDFAAAAQRMPSFHIEAWRLCEEADQVWVHALVTGLPQGACAITVDIWRFEGEAIAEHWDVGQRLASADDARAKL